MKVRDGLYHTATGLPTALVSAAIHARCFPLRYSDHAKQAAISDRYGVPQKVPSNHVFTLGEIFEAEVEDGQVVKFCARIPSAGITTAGRTFDLVLVCSVAYPSLYVRTLWLNEPGDEHSTLDKSKYIPYAC